MLILAKNLLVALPKSLKSNGVAFVLVERVLLQSQQVTAVTSVPGVGAFCFSGQSLRYSGESCRQMRVTT